MEIGSRNNLTWSLAKGIYTKGLSHDFEDVFGVEADGFIKGNSINPDQLNK